MNEIKILVVDDEEESLATLTERLIDRDFDVLSATSGEEALEIMKHLSIDVVLLDIIMPEMNGIKALGEMVKNQPGVEVIMVSGLADIGTTLDAMTLGAFDYLIKPVDIEELVGRINDALKRRQLRQKGAIPPNNSL